MLTQDQFARLLESPESSILDFKTTMYDFKNDTDKKKISAFIKDIISFGNTIRNTTSYIIIGVKENSDNSKELLGINEVIDDAILQEKVKNKIHPRPEFSFYTLENKELKFGVFEFPIVKYPTPLFPTENMRGIEIGKIYHRKGTSNSEALGMESININEWLKGLPENSSTNNFHDRVSSILQRITSKKEMLSEVIPELLSIAKLNGLSDIEQFCKAELIGLKQEHYNENPDSYEEKFEYRIIRGYVSPLEISINPYHRFNDPVNQIRKEMDNNDNIVRLPILLTYSLKTIEGYIEKFERDPTNYMITLKYESNAFFPNTTGYVYFVCFQDDYQNLYRNINQKFIDLLISL